MPSMLERCHLARRAGRVTRYHAQTLVRAEDVATHSFGVVSLIMIMTEQQCSARLLMAALSHDMGEYATGDIPSPVKRKLGVEARGELAIMEGIAMTDITGIQGELTEWEHLLLKTADGLDGLLKCIEEAKMGNCFITECGENYAAYLDDMLPALGGGPAADLVRAALNEWHWS